MRFVLYQSQINVEQNYTSIFYFFLIWVLFSSEKNVEHFYIFSFSFENDNENKKSGRIVLLGMIQTMFDQNMSPID